MESLKQEALYVAMEKIKGDVKNLQLLMNQSFEVRPLIEGTPFFKTRIKEIELPRIDKKVVDDVDMSQNFITEAPQKTVVPIVVPKEESQKTQKPIVKKTSSKKKSSKRKYDIDLIS